jgi:hypothetical protein
MGKGNSKGAERARRERTYGDSYLGVGRKIPHLQFPEKNKVRKGVQDFCPTNNSAANFCSQHICLFSRVHTQGIICVLEVHCNQISLSITK